MMLMLNISGWFVFFRTYLLMLLRLFRSNFCYCTKTLSINQQDNTVLVGKTNKKKQENLQQKHFFLSAKRLVGIIFCCNRYNARNTAELS